MKFAVCMHRPAASTFLFAAVTAMSVLIPAALEAEEAPRSRWSGSLPPTPADIQQDDPAPENGLRRLPPIDQESESEATSVETKKTETSDASKVTTGAAKQIESPVASKSTVEPVPADWSSPRLVIGPSAEVRQVSHERQAEAPRRSRYSSAPVETSPPEVIPIEAMQMAGPVFARVFDDEPTDVADSTEDEDVSTQVATASGELSPIFVCRLLGLKAAPAQSDVN